MKAKLGLLFAMITFSTNGGGCRSTNKLQLSESEPTIVPVRTSQHEFLGSYASNQSNSRVQMASMEMTGTSNFELRLTTLVGMERYKIRLADGRARCLGCWVFEGDGDITIWNEEKQSGYWKIELRRPESQSVEAIHLRKLEITSTWAVEGSNAQEVHSVAFRLEGSNLRMDLIGDETTSHLLTLDTENQARCLKTCFAFKAANPQSDMVVALTREAPSVWSLSIRSESESRSFKLVPSSKSFTPAPELQGIYGQFTIKPLQSIGTGSFENVSDQLHLVWIKHEEKNVAAQQTVIEFYFADLTKPYLSIAGSHRETQECKLAGNCFAVEGMGFTFYVQQGIGPQASTYEVFARVARSSVGSGELWTLAKRKFVSIEPRSSNP